jgi:hypothetical protein
LSKSFLKFNRIAGEHHDHEKLIAALNQEGEILARIILNSYLRIAEDHLIHEKLHN